MLRTRTVLMMLTVLLATAALAACGSDAKTKAEDAPDATTSTMAPFYDSSTSAPPTTTTAGGTTSALTKTVTDHLKSVHNLTAVVVVDGTGALVITTSAAKTDTEMGVTICNDAAMVAGQAAMKIDAADGTQIAGRTSGGECTA